MKLTGVFEQAAEGGFVAHVAAIPGANRQGKTREEARENLREAVALRLAANPELAERSISRRQAQAIREPLRVDSH